VAYLSEGSLKEFTSGCQLPNFHSVVGEAYVGFWVHVIAVLQNVILKTVRIVK